MLRPIGIILFLCLLGVSAAPAAHAQGDLLVASSDEHIWIVRPSHSTPERCELLHHALRMPGPYAAPIIPMSRKPEAIAAFGERVWVIFPPDETTSAGRSVSTLRVRHRPEIDMYGTDPDGRFALVDMLPGGGQLIDFAATAQGPFALIRSLTHDESRWTFTLHRMRGDRWAATPLPDQLEQLLAVQQNRASGARLARLAADGHDRSRLNLLVTDPDNPSSAILFRRDADGEWSGGDSTIELRDRSIHTLTSTRGRLVAAATHRSRPDALLEILYVRDDRLLPLASVDLSDAQHEAHLGDSPWWEVVGTDRGLHLLMLERATASDEPSLTMRDIDWISGSVSEAQRMTPPPLPTGRLLHISLMLTIAVVAVLLLLLVRPGAAAAEGPGGARGAAARGQAGRAHVSAKGAISLPKGTAVLSPISRTIALLIDLLPGAILSLLILRVPPAELLRLPVMTHSLAQAGPYLIMIGIALAHMTLSELIWKTTIGKALMGGRVIGQDGQPPGIRQVFMRNLLKAVILMVPPLAIFALISPHLQGLNDLLAKTVVIGDLVEEEKADDET